MRRVKGKAMPRARSSSRTRASADTMRRLIGIMPYAYFRLRAVGEGLSGDDCSTGDWGLMRSLAADGPQSVAQIARQRPVPRQSVQHMADALAARELVEFVDNPAHQRARLLRLTAKGAALLEVLERRQAAWVKVLAESFGEAEVATALDVLARLRAVFGQWLDDDRGASLRHR